MAGFAAAHGCHSGPHGGSLDKKRLRSRPCPLRRRQDGLHGGIPRYGEPSDALEKCAADRHFSQMPLARSKTSAATSGFRRNVVVRISIFVGVLAADNSRFRRCEGESFMEAATALFEVFPDFLDQWCKGTSQSPNLLFYDARNAERPKPAEVRVRRSPIRLRNTSTDFGNGDRWLKCVMVLNTTDMLPRLVRSSIRCGAPLVSDARASYIDERSISVTGCAAATPLGVIAISNCFRLETPAL